MPKATFKGSAGKSNGGARKGAASSNPNRTVSSKAQASGPGVRSTATINRLNMYRTKVKRDTSGKIKSGGLAVGQTVREMKPARVQPDRRWFGNTRVVGQKELADFREQMDQTTADPYAVLLKRHKLPMGLLADGNIKKGRVDLLRAESYKQTFGSKAQRKRPKLSADSEYASLVATAQASAEKYDPEVDSNIQREIELIGPKNYIFDAGQSRRIRHELFKVSASRLTLSPGPQGPDRDRASAPEPKPEPEPEPHQVIDSSDVLVEVLDARDPIGTRCPHAEAFLKKEAKHKHLVFLLNKCDLVPTKVTRPSPPPPCTLHPPRLAPSTTSTRIPPPAPTLHLSCR